MEETFKRIPPEDVFITVFKRKPTEEELWMGVPPDFDGNRPSGNNLHVLATLQDNRAISQLYQT